MVEKDYPNIDQMCRLCLKENAGDISIFQCESQLSIPMRIMSCAGLEVQETDNLPKMICSECRYELEKFFYFRKRSQYADGKLKKHLRLLGSGKKSRIFAKNEGNEDDDDELIEFEDSRTFIRKYDDIREENIKAKQAELVLSLRPAIREEVIKEVEDTYERNIYPQMRKKISEEVRQDLREEVKDEVKLELRQEVEESLRNEMIPNLKEECREEEIRSLLFELGGFLKEKRGKVLNPSSQENIEDNNSILLKMKIDDQRHEGKRFKRKLPIEESESDANPQNNQKPKLIVGDEAAEEILSDPIQETLTINYEEIKNNTDETSSCDQDNESNGFFIIDNINENTIQHDQDSNGDLLFVNNSDYEADSSGKTAVTSYQIETEDSEPYIKRKSSFKIGSNKEETETETETETSIVILNYEQPSMDDEQLEMVEFVNLNEKKVKETQKVGDLLEEDMCYKVLDNETKTQNSIKPVVPHTNRPSDTPKTFKCASCPMRFSTETAFNRHAKTHLKVAEKGVSYQCPACLIHLSCKSALTRHMVIHSGAKPYTCEECGKSFIQREILKRHMQTHTGIKPYKCPHCDRNFAQKANLTTHINKNHMEIPIVGQHSCPLCPKRFNHSSGLSRHLATHSGVAFQCTECDRTFSDRSSVKRHITCVHNMTVDVDDIK